MLERFTRERQRASKGAAFHLDDEVDLTHYGQSLSKLDDFADAGLGLESDQEEATGPRSIQVTLPMLTPLRSDRR
jgi:nucleolar protein 14